MRLHLSVSTLCLVSLSALFATEVPLRINAGGLSIEENGVRWISDEVFAKGGSPFGFQANHDFSGSENAAPPELYRSVRHQNHAYLIPDLAPGRYQIRFHFIDEHQGDGRAMSYEVNKRQVIKDLSVVSAAGGAFRPFSIDIITEVGDNGTLLIAAHQGNGNDVFEAGIEIFRAPQNATITETPITPPAAPRALKPGATPAPSPAELAQALRTSAGAPTRLVWSQTDNLHDTCIEHNGARLYAMDTEGSEAGKERLVLPTARSYAKPIFTPQGDRIVFTDQNDGHCYVVDFDGSNLRQITSGFASDVWEDPQTGILWVYVRKSFHSTKGEVVRHQLDNPTIAETIWNRSEVGHEKVPWFRLSPDGTRAAGAFPWSQCGVADLTTGKWKNYGGGCWVSMAPDTTHRVLYFLGNHIEVTLYNDNGKPLRNIQVNTMPEVGGQKVYHPRWSNHPRFLTVTGPQHSTETELYFGRFDEKTTKVEEWVRVTHNNSADFYGDSWIQGAHKISLATTQGRKISSLIAKPEPESTPQPIFSWLNGADENSDPIVIRDKAIYTPSRALDVTGGSFAPEATVSQQLLSKIQANGEFTLKIMFTPMRQTDGTLIDFSNQSGEPNFRLYQSNNALYFQIRIGSEIARVIGLGTYSEPWQSLIITGNKTSLTCFIAGKPIELAREDSESTMPIDFGSWKPAFLTFGDSSTNEDDWSGILEHVEILDHCLTDAEVTESWNKSKHFLTDRTIRNSPTVKATLLSTTPTPDMISLGAYHRSLAERVYDTPGGKIVVLEWCVLDRQSLPIPEIGLTRILSLSPIDENPQLSAEHQTTNPENLSLPQFYSTDR